MKNINKIIRMASVGAALAVVFTLAFATPAFAHAQSYGGGSYNGSNYNNHNYSTQSYYVSNSGYNYSYNYSHPAPAPAPAPVTYPVYYPVYYQQPVVVQQPEPVPVYTPVYTPVYQQPVPQPQPVPVYTPVPTPVYQQPVYQTYTNGNLVAACFADRTTATIGTPVTWSVEVTGGTGQYAYSWSGSGGLAGTGASAIQSYGTTGQKNATVLINSNGQTISQACGDSVSVHAYVAKVQTYYRAPAPSVSNTSNQNQNNPNTLSANSLFSLGNVPWGWVAILIIIILGVTVFYLIFNRNNKEV